MKLFQRTKQSRWLLKKSGLKYENDCVALRINQWQEARTWARLICESEKLLQIEVRELRKLGELELYQLKLEVPICLRQRVNRWLFCYAVSTRINT